MTSNERIERARRAKLAMDEFLAPALAHVEDYYAAKMIEVAASTNPRAPDIIARLANGVKVAREIRARIDAIIMDGGLAERERERAEALKDMSAPKRRLLNIASH